MCDCQISDFLFFLLFLLSSSRAQVAFLDRSERSIRHNACIRPRMCLFGVATISDYIYGVKSQKTSPKLGGNRHFTTWLTTWAILEKCKIRSNWVVKGSRGLLFEFWDPLYISGTVAARNFKFGRHIIKGTNEKNAKLGQRGREGVTWPTFEILGPPPYFGNGWS